jgi:hypothetical protein
MDYPCQQEEPSWFRQVLLDAAATSACQGQQQSAKPSSSLLSGSVATTTATGGGGSITERLHRDCTPADLWIGGIIDDVADGDDRELRTSFQRRVASFRPTNYFGRPTSLSPVVCARFGYVCRFSNMVLCWGHRRRPRAEGNNSPPEGKVSELRGRSSSEGGTGQ